ncbi:MAG: AAA family ATPase [Micropepsaceae bacterium]
MSESELLPELQAVRWAGREIFVAFDSDIVEKPRVAAAESRLSAILGKRGAICRKVRLPEGATGEKVGLDDYFLVHDFDDFVQLTKSAEVTPGSYEPPVAISDLMSARYPPTTWLWHELILQGEVNLLYGDGGTGKSLLALHAAVHIASGRALLGKPTKKVPVIALFAEDGPAEVQCRLRAIFSDNDIDERSDLPIRLWCQPREEVLLAVIDDTGIIAEQQRLHALRAELARIGEPALVILDGMADQFALNETLRLPVNAALKRVLGGLCRDFHATILVLAHPSKASMMDGTNYSGSTAFNNAVRQRLTLEIAKKDVGGVGDGPPPRTLRVAKSNYGASGELTLWFNGYSIATKPSGRVISAEDARNAILSTMLDLIDRDVRVINNNGPAGDARTLNDFTKTVNERHAMRLVWRDVKDELRRLVDDGWLAYRPAEKRTRPHVKAAFIRGIRCPT